MKKNKGFAMSNSMGFTLIELLVVVAIIGILASIVLASLNDARKKGNDKAVMTNMKNAMNQGEIIYNTRTANQNTYVSVCLNGTVDGVKGVGAMIEAAAKATGLAGYTRNPGTPGGTLTTATCNDSASAWAAEVPLKETANTMWCVDSVGKARKTTTSIGLTTVCP